MVEVASCHVAEVTEIQGPEDGAIDEEEFIEKLDSDDFAVAATVHPETATGTFQPVQKIAADCQERDTLLLMDAVTSLGGWTSAKTTRVWTPVTRAPRSASPYRREGRP